MTIHWEELHQIHGPEALGTWARARALGLDFPFDVFEQLFFDHHADHDFAAIVHPIDWQSVAWQDTELSGSALRRVAVPRAYQRALDEARWRTVELGLQDERLQVLEHWRSRGTWIRSPILIGGELLASSVGIECLVGFTRLGTLLGLLDRGEIAEQAMHPVWLGSSLKPPA